MKVYKFYMDPGHGWLAVKRSELDDLGIASDISSFSYEKGATVYLEEDCDASRFFDAYEKRYGVKPAYISKHTNRDSPIRSYPCFQGAK